MESLESLERPAAVAHHNLQLYLQDSVAAEGGDSNGTKDGPEQNCVECGYMDEPKSPFIPRSSSALYRYVFPAFLRLPPPPSFRHVGGDYTDFLDEVIRISLRKS